MESIWLTEDNVLHGSTGGVHSMVGHHSVEQEIMLIWSLTEIIASHVSMISSKEFLDEIAELRGKATKMKTEKKCRWKALSRLSA